MFATGPVRTLVKLEARADDTFPVRIELSPTAEQLERFVDAEMRVVGRAAGEVNDRRQFISPRVVVENLADIETVREAQAPFTAYLADARIRATGRNGSTDFNSSI